MSQNRSKVLELTQMLADLCRECEDTTAYELEDGTGKSIIREAGITEWWKAYQAGQNAATAAEKERILKKLTPAERKVLGH